jgi:quinol monooxygenase YgiN
MAFVQIMEVQASDYDAIEKLHEEWLAATEGERTVRRELVCQDRDRPGTYVIVVEFDSYEEAMKNSELPATAKIAEGMAALAKEPPTFRNLDVVRQD